MIITIAGRKGSGKSTTGKLLAQQLGYEYVYMGMRFRKEAQKRNMTIQEFDVYVQNHPEIDKQMDEELYHELAGKDNLVVDANVGAYFLPHALKVFFTAPLAVRAKRVAKNPRVEEINASEEETANILTMREQNVDQRLQKLYGFSMLDESNYDIIVDTQNLSVQEVANYIKQHASEQNIQL